MTDSHFHNLVNHQKAISVFETIANKKVIKQLDIDSLEIKRLFISGDDVATVLFWDVLFTDPDFDHVQTVDYCHCCEKFIFDLNTL